MISPDRLAAEAGTLVGATAYGWPAVARTLVTHLLDIEEHLPPVGLPALDTAEQQWSGNPDPAALLEARRQVREYYDTTRPVGAYDDEGRAIQALLCVLEVPGSSQHRADLSDGSARCFTASATSPEAT